MDTTRRNIAKRVATVVLGAAVVLFAGLMLYRAYAQPPLAETVFEGDSDELAATRIVATLDEPFDPDENAIWCASFLAMWKTLESDLAEGPIELEDSPEMADALNRAADPREHVPAENLYTAAGWRHKGIVEEIAADLAERFPDETPPTFEEALPHSFIGYAYLEANIPFDTPYLQNDEPLVFTDATGAETELRSFGLRSKDANAHMELREQPAILYTAGENLSEPSEFIIDLDRNSAPSQIVAAMIEPEDTLEATLEAVEARIAEHRQPGQEPPGLGASDRLLVPDMVWEITHRFSELEGRAFRNEPLEPQSLDIAEQDIAFRLDRSGAQLRSRAEAVFVSALRVFVFDRPFLLYMKKRGAETPYFVKWLGNAELLNDW